MPNYKLHTENHYHPFGWYCFDENYDGAPDAKGNIIGHGQTEREAMENYIENFFESMEEEKTDVETLADKIDQAYDRMKEEGL
jgi:hypothetical protein